MKSYSNSFELFLFLLIPALYMGVLFALTWKARLKGKAADLDYFLGGRKTHPFFALVSVVATETSVASIIVFPAAGFSSGLSVLWLASGYIVGRSLAAFFYLRKFYEMNEISIYSAMAPTVLSRDVLGGFYLLAKFLSSGGRFFLGGFALSQMFGGSTYLWLIIVTLVVGLYSLSGGIRAVILTDQLQGWIILLMGVFLLFFIAFQIPPDGFLGLERMLPLDLDFDPTNARNSLALFLGGIVLTIGTHAADQDMIQRILSTRTYEQARRSLFLSGPAAFLVIGVYTAIGLLLFSLSKDWGIKLEDRSPLVSFIAHSNSPFLSGTFAVLIIAAAMSTMDSAIHSTGAVWKGLFRSDQSGRKWSFLSLVVLLFFGFVFVELAKVYESFLDLVMGSMNYINGGLIGIVTAYTFFPNRLRSSGIVSALVSGFVTTFVCTWILKPGLAWPWTTLMSSMVALLFLVAASIIQQGMVNMLESGRGEK